MRSFTILLLGLALVATAPASDAQQPGVNVVVTIENVREARGALMVRLTDGKQGWPGGPSVAAKATPAQAGAMTVTFPNIRPGRYAAMAYHDIDGNGRLKTGAFGIPAEPYAFSRNAAIRMGPPKFADAAFDVGAAEVRQSTRLR